MISLSKHLRRATSCTILAILMAAPVAAKDSNPGNSEGHGNSDVAHGKSGPGNASDAAAANANPNANLGVGSSGDGGNSASDVLLAAITPTGAATASALVFTNTGSRAGSAIVTLYAADTGAQIATFTTASIPALGSLAVKVAEIVSGATPALTTAQAAAVLNAGVSASFDGDVQVVNAGATGVANLTACGKSLSSVDTVLGNVAGPGSTGFTDAVRIVNAGAQTGHVAFTIHDAVDGSVLGTWTSADVPSHGGLTTSVTTIAAAATPVVSASKTSLIVVANQLGGDLSLQHLSQVKGTTAITDLSSVCSIHGGAGHAQSADSSGDDTTDDSGDGVTAGATSPATGSN